MAEALVKDEDQFRCSVCLEPLKEPVTIPCGHSYCMSCIGGCWDQEERRGEFSCPQCREKFFPRPALKKNTMLSELVDKMKTSGAQTDHAAVTPIMEPEVQCDFCSEGNANAVKSCLVCQVSLCDTHLQPHNDIPALKKHKLVKAMPLEEVICPQHGNLLQVFCRTDQKCICILCTMDDHKGHDTVSAAAERKSREGQFGDMQMKFQQRIQEREKELKDVREAVKSHISLAQKAEQHSEKAFTRLLESIERRRVEVREQIRGQQKVAVSHAERILEELEEEVTELRRGDAELEQLTHNDNHVHFLQIFHGLETSLECKGLPSIGLSAEPSFKDLRRSLSVFEKGIEKICERDMKKINKTLRNIKVVLPPMPTMQQDFLKYSCQLTLDPNTAHPSISLSEDNRKATRVEEEQQYPDHPERFEEEPQVLCKEGLTGRCYWEVEFSSDQDNNTDICVAYKAIGRKMEEEKEDETNEEIIDKMETNDGKEEVDGGDKDDGGNDTNDAADEEKKEDDDDEEEEEGDGAGNDVNASDAAAAADTDDYVYTHNQCAFGLNDQSWTFYIGCTSSKLTGSFYHNCKKSRCVSVPSARIGVYLDHRQGVLSFYSVSDTMTLLHTEHTTFTQPLYPGFGLDEQSSVTLSL